MNGVNTLVLGGNPCDDRPMASTQSTALAQLRVFEALGENCGVFLYNPETGESALRLRRDWEEFAGDEADVLGEIAADLPGKLAEMGAIRFLEWADNTLSNTFRVSEPRTTLAGEIERTAQALYRKFVHSTVRRYETHLPVYSIRAAAGGFGRDMAAHAEGWIEVDVPGRRDLSEDLFLIRIEGRSMEPDIPDGSLCVFRAYYGGSRKGGIFLVQRISTLDDGGEVTIKRYDSSKEYRRDGTWVHTRIKMRPDNSDEFQEWDLKREEDSFITIAQFVCVIEGPELPSAS